MTRPLATGLIVSVPTKGGMGEQPSLCRDNHSATRPSFYSLRPFRDTFLRGTCLNLPRQEGGVFAHTARSVLATIFKRSVADLGCSRRIRTVSSAYEAEMLPLHHHCYIDYFSLTFCKYYIIIFTKVQNLKRKDFGSLWVYQPWSE